PIFPERSDLRPRLLVDTNEGHGADERRMRPLEGLASRFVVLACRRLVPALELTLRLGERGSIDVSDGSSRHLVASPGRCPSRRIGVPLRLLAGRRGDLLGLPEGFDGGLEPTLRDVQVRSFETSDTLGEQLVASGKKIRRPARCDADDLVSHGLRLRANVPY